MVQLGFASIIANSMRSRRRTHIPPRIDDFLDSLVYSRYFTTLDANCGYWKIGVAPADTYKTTFTSHRGLYSCKRMLFGLMSAPATFQRAIDVILSTVGFKYTLNYLDDIFIYSPFFEQHLVDLTMVLRLLNETGVSLKLSKCSFAALKVHYLGYKVGRNGLQVDESKVEAVLRANPPKTKTGLRLFLGMTDKTVVLSSSIPLLPLLSTNILKVIRQRCSS
jgi:hypothetical protein